MSTRWWWGWASGAFGVLALVLGRAPLFAWLLVVGLVAAGELYRLARAGGAQPSALIGLIAIFDLLAIAYTMGERAPRLFPAVVAATLGAAFVELMMRRERPQAIRSLAFTVAPVLVVGVLGGYILALRRSLFGFRLALGLGLLWAGAEAGIYVVTRTRAGDKRLAIMASIAGALVTSVLLALAIGEPFSWGRSLVLGVLVGTSTAAGHLAGAMLEQGQARLKLVPFLDGLFVSAPVFFYAFRMIGR